MRVEWVASKSCTLPQNMVYPALLPLVTLLRTPRLPAVDWTDHPANLNGLVRFAERPNLVSAHVPSHFDWPGTQQLTGYSANDKFDPRCYGSLSSQSDPALQQLMWSNIFISCAPTLFPNGSLGQNSVSISWFSIPVNRPVHSTILLTWTHTHTHNTHTPHIHTPHHTTHLSQLCNVSVIWNQKHWTIVLLGTIPKVTFMLNYVTKLQPRSNDLMCSLILRYSS